MLFVEVYCVFLCLSSFHVLQLHISGHILAPDNLSGWLISLFVDHDLSLRFSRLYIFVLNNVSVILHQARKAVLERRPTMKLLCRKA